MEYVSSLSSSAVSTSTTHYYTYHTGAASNFKITTQCWVLGSAQYTVNTTGEIILSAVCLSHSRMSSLMSFLRKKEEGEKCETVRLMNTAYIAF